MTDELHIKAKAEAFDRLEEKVKYFRRRTNDQYARYAYQRVLDEIERELIIIGLYDRCASCRAPLSWQVAKWAYSKGIYWFCGEHYSEYENTSDIIKKHKRSFKLLVAKLEKVE